VKYCPNFACPHRARFSTAVEFEDHVTVCSDCGGQLALRLVPSDAPAPPASAKPLSSRELAVAALVAHVVTVLAEAAMVASLASADGRAFSYWTAVAAAGGALILGAYAARRAEDSSAGGCLAIAGCLQLLVLAFIAMVYFGVLSQFGHGRVLTNP
jgi:hypothetical protein